jgi:hypothetical protein
MVVLAHIAPTMTVPVNIVIRRVAVYPAANRANCSSMVGQVDMCRIWNKRRVSVQRYS